MVTEDFKEKVLSLYPGYVKLFGPYRSGSDGRARVFLKGPGVTTTRLLAKVTLEVKLNRRLVGDETVDHKDENRLNDDAENLQVLSLAENSKKSAIGNKYGLGFKQTAQQRRSGDKNGKAILTNEDVKNFRAKYSSGELTKEGICEMSGLSERSVRNFLTGVSYVDAGGPLASPRKKGRPKAEM